MEISFIENMNSGINDWNGLEKWIVNSVKNESKIVGSLSFVFMDDEELLSYNQQYLNHDYYTDVITFDDSEFPLVNGDILISLSMVIFNSNKLKINYKEELLRVIIHGVLHLCGYKDKEDSDIEMMRTKEEFYLNRVKFKL